MKTTINITLIDAQGSPVTRQLHACMGCGIRWAIDYAANPTMYGKIYKDAYFFDCEWPYNALALSFPLAELRASLAIGNVVECVCMDPMPFNDPPIWSTPKAAE